MKATEVNKGTKLFLPGYPEPVEVTSIKNYPNQGFLEFRGAKGEKHTTLYNAMCLEATPETQAIALLQGRDRVKSKSKAPKKKMEMEEDENLFPSPTEIAIWDNIQD